MNITILSKHQVYDYMHNVLIFMELCAKITNCPNSLFEPSRSVLLRKTTGPGQNTGDAAIVA